MASSTADGGEVENSINLQKRERHRAQQSNMDDAEKEEEEEEEERNERWKCARTKKWKWKKKKKEGRHKFPSPANHPTRRYDPIRCVLRFSLDLENEKKKIFARFPFFLSLSLYPLRVDCRDPVWRWFTLTTVALSSSDWFTPHNDVILSRRDVFLFLDSLRMRRNHPSWMLVSQIEFGSVLRRFDWLTTENDVIMYQWSL